MSKEYRATSHIVDGTNKSDEEYNDSCRELEEQGFKYLGGHLTNIAGISCYTKLYSIDQPTLRETVIAFLDDEMANGPCAVDHRVMIRKAYDRESNAEEG